MGNLQKSLVSVTPREVLGLFAMTVSTLRILGRQKGGTYPDVLVGVLDTLLQRWHVRPMLPMLVPENVCVDAGADEGGNADAV